MKKRIPFFLVLLFVSCKTPTKEYTISIGFVGELISLDPHMRSESITCSVNSNIFEPLVRLDENMSIHPLLAKSCENLDARIWVFNLRENVLFHSGNQGLIRPFL